MLSFRFKFLLIIALVFSTPLFGLPSFFSGTSGSGGFFSFTDSNRTSTRNAMGDTIQQIQRQIDANQLSSAMASLRVLSSQIKDAQKNVLETYFPPQFEGFSSSMQPTSQADDSAGDFSGMIFAKRYQNAQRQMIDINVVFSDGTIAEYASLMNNPHLLKGFDNATVIKIGPYSALEKFSPNDRYLERNIVLNGDILVNIVANGISTKDAMNTLCKLIDFAALEKYLKN